MWVADKLPDPESGMGAVLALQPAMRTAAAAETATETSRTNSIECSSRGPPRVEDPSCQKRFAAAHRFHAKGECRFHRRHDRHRYLCTHPARLARRRGH